MTQELNNQNTSEFEPQVLALAQYLDCDPDDLTLESYKHYGLGLYSHGTREYAIGTDEEADEAARQYIEDSVWAFNATFLADYIPLSPDQIQKLQAACEDANESFVALISQCSDFDDFVRDAIRADGRGPFLNGYDSEEHELEFVDSDGEKTYFYAYRVN
jgi:hypothetical protein